MIELRYITQGGWEFFYYFPTKLDVCPVCQGRGSYVNPAIDGNGLGADDFAEDPDFEESYHAGVYDITCVNCGGHKVVDAVDEGKLSKRQLFHYNMCIKQQREQLTVEREEARMQARGIEF
jgi:hypothetical protein